jgi:hypothetical protein
MERIWFDKDRENFYSIPDSAELEDGDYLLRSLTAGSRRVDRDDARAYWISKTEATDRLGAHVDSAWGSIVGAVDSLFAMGRPPVSEDDEDGEAAEPARSPLPEHLEDVLGMKPGALLTEPGQVRERIRSAASSLGLNLKIHTNDDEEDIEEDDFTDEVLKEAEESEEEAPSSAGDPLRDFFSRPEVTGALSGFGRALSRLGAQIQDAAGPAKKDDAE